MSTGTQPVARQQQDGLSSITRVTRVNWARTCGGAAAVLTLVVVCGYIVGLLDAPRMAAGMTDIVELIADAWPPNFSDLSSWWHPLWDSLSMSVAATALAVLLSVPMALLGARNTSPHPAVYWVIRMLLNSLRAVPELIMAIVFVAAVGFGALPGALALGIHSAGMVGKFFAEAIEHAAEAPIEAARAVGSTPSQVILHGVLPQVLPQMADVTIYRWEYNFRASVVVGVVGAGGIGFELIAALRTLEYHEVAAILVVILATVTVVDGLGGLLRKRFA